MMMVLINHLNNERQWIIYNFDFSRDIRFDLAFLAVPVCIGLVTLASIVPAISIKNIAQNIRDFFQTQSNQPISQSIGLLPQATDDIPSNSYQSPGLPRSHLLGSGPELSHKVVMYVSTGELPGLPVSEIQTYQIPVHYWRSFTYDVYTGLGWYTSFTHNESFGRNKNALPNPLPARYVLTQKIKPVEDLGGILYASGDVISVDAPYRISMREFEDPFGVTTRSKEYQATSSVLIMDADLLRKAGQKYPEWIKQRYLALPDDLHSRVRVLAASLTVTASTPYDRAIAIETYLRKIPYTLDLGAPPAGKDVVDYFIFELRKGYCDYFASAMVVMARATGLPARLAVGYASGAYDANNARYVVTEADAHSWVEIYFPNYGWVEFEPTSNRSEL